MTSAGEDATVLLHWTNLALDLIVTHKPNPVRAGRALALLHAATYDAVVAAADAESAFGREGAPAVHAAVAGAAAAVLAEVFPDEPATTFDELTEDVGRSHPAAAAGLRLGGAVGELAVNRARGDGSDASWDGVRPSGPGVWEPTPPAHVDPPLEPLAGTWETWILSSGDAARPIPPPPPGSPAFAAELAAVQDAVARRTPEQRAAAEFWAGGPGTVTPGGLWVEIARDLIVRDGLELAHAARVLALTSIAIADAFVCCWDAKYAFWLPRPITADPSLDVLFPTPPFPSYTSGHATVSAAAGTILGHLFPADAADLRRQADEARDSRLWAGIHYPIDNEMGATMGAAVGRLVADVARHNGAE
jgi:membrane-associated phospholipid phosphatase